MQPANPATSQSAATLHPGDLLNEHEVADLLRVKLQTLRNWRWSGKGPHFFHVGERLIRYRRADLQAFLERGKNEKAAL